MDCPKLELGSKGGKTADSVPQADHKSKRKQLTTFICNRAGQLLEIYETLEVKKNEEEVAFLLMSG
jgi:hypothetical protein